MNTLYHILFQVWPARLSAQSVIMGQVLCFFFMVLPLMAFSMWNEWQHQQQTQMERLLGEVNALASRQTSVTGSTESLLLALSLSPEVRRGDPELLYPFLSKFDKCQKDYAGFALFRMDGSSVVSFLEGAPRNLPQDVVLHRKYFSAAVSRLDFTVGKALELPGGRVILPMAIPILDEQHRPRYVLLAPLSMENQSEIIHSLLGESDSKVFLFDAAFTRLFGHDGSGKVNLPFSRSFIVERLLPHAFSYTEGDRRGRATFSFVSPEGEDLVGCMAVLRQGTAPYMYILAFEDDISWIEFWNKWYLLPFSGLSLVAVVLLFVASFTGRLCFINGLQRLVSVAGKAQEGDGSARCGEVSGCREVVILGAAFDTMLDTLEEKTESLRRLSGHDPLTGLWNRRRFNEAALLALKDALRYGRPVTLAMADIDFFKKINDTYGHAGGDAVLQKIAALFRATTRATDSVARFGGEEFIFLFPQTTAEQAALLLERMRGACEQARVLHQEQTIRFTSSFGVSELGQRDMTAETLLEILIREADAALYQSKERGRNQITCYDHSSVQ